MKLFKVFFILFITPLLGFSDNLDKQIGQMLMVGFKGTQVSDNTYLKTCISQGKIGGVILFDLDVAAMKAAGKKVGLSVTEVRKGPLVRKDGSVRFPKNITSPKQLKTLTSTIQRISQKAKQPIMLIATDFEGGLVNRLAPDYGFMPFPSAERFSQLRLKKAQSLANKAASQLRHHGINYVLGPVVDININKKSPIIARLGRSFSSNPVKVTDYAKLFAKAYDQAGIAFAFKHFPGHGSAVGDTHLGFQEVSGVFNASELVPYLLLLNDAFQRATVMPAHIVNTKIDAVPASLSSVWIDFILRRLIGFDGVVISDDLQMQAITKHYSLEETIKLALLAGNDILLFGGQLTADDSIVKKVHQIVRKLVAQGTISKARIAQSYQRILALKEKLN